VAGMRRTERGRWVRSGFLARLGASLLPGAVLLAVLLLVAGSRTATAGDGEDPGDLADALLGGDSAEEAFFLLEEQVVTTASKRAEPASTAPAIMSVITEDEIRKMGARTFLDVLRRVPGLNISISGFGQWMIGVRGIRTAGTEKVRLLIDGHAVNEAFIGSGLTFFDDLPVENLKKIEVIRGPGSALHGANAFVGVINLVTKTARDLDGVELSTGFGSFNTLTVDGQVGKVFENGLEVSVYAHYWQSDGMRELVARDAQTLQDEITGSTASLAPGRTTFQRQKTLLSLRLGYEGFQSKTVFGWRDREDYLGLSLSLNRDSDLEELQLFQELGYDVGDAENDIVASHSKVYFDLFSEDILFQQNPPGHIRSKDLDGDGVHELFPDGRKSKIELSNLKIGGEQQVDISPVEEDVITLGLVFEHVRQFHVTGQATQDRVTGDPLPTLVDFTDMDNFNRNAKRDVLALYAQNVWRPTDDLALTAGVRWDHYSDFGSTVNPRAGLVWSFTEQATIKLLYGRAFRAPNFRELYDRVGFSSGGNPNLDPEVINTVEAELSYRVTDYLKARLNYFYTNIQDIILEDTGSKPRLFVNRGDATVQGFESEVVAALQNGWYAYANYSFVRPRDGDGHRIPDVPLHTGNLGFNVQLDRATEMPFPWPWDVPLNLNVNLLFVGPRGRSQGDPRPNVDEFFRLDTTLGVELADGVELSGSIYNLLDDDIREPAPFVVTNDYPMPGRTFFVRLRVRF